MEDYQQRVVDEEKALAEKLGKLEVFIQGHGFKALSDVDRTLLNDQAGHMRSYLHVLRLRIGRFTLPA